MVWITFVEDYTWCGLLLSRTTQIVDYFCRVGVARSRVPPRVVVREDPSSHEARNEHLSLIDEKTGLSNVGNAVRAMQRRALNLTIL